MSRYSQGTSRRRHIHEPVVSVSKLTHMLTMGQQGLIEGLERAADGSVAADDELGSKSHSTPSSRNSPAWGWWEPPLSV